METLTVHVLLYCCSIPYVTDSVWATVRLNTWDSPKHTSGCKILGFHHGLVEVFFLLGHNIQKNKDLKCSCKRGRKNTFQIMQCYFLLL